MGELTKAKLTVDLSKYWIEGRKNLRVYKGNAEDIARLVEQIEKEDGNFGGKSLYQNPINAVHTYQFADSYALVHPDGFEPKFGIKEGDLSISEEEELLKTNLIFCGTRSSYVTTQFYPNILTENERKNPRLPAEDWEILASIVQKRLPVPEMYRKLPVDFLGEECSSPATNVLFVGLEETDGGVDRYMCWTYLCDKHFKAFDKATFGSEKNPIIHYKHPLADHVPDTPVFGQKVLRREGRIFPSRIHVCEDLDKLNMPHLVEGMTPRGKIPYCISIMKWREDISIMPIREVVMESKYCYGG